MILFMTSSLGFPINITFNFDTQPWLGPAASLMEPQSDALISSRGGGINLSLTSNITRSWQMPQFDNQ